MGSFFSRKPSPATALEKIALEIGDCRQRIQLLGERQSTALFYFTVLTFLLSSVVNAQMYLQYEYPRNLIIVSLIFLSSIVFTIIGRNLIYRVYQWRVKRNSQKMEHAESQKVVLLDLVKETLSFKEAKQILDRYEVEEKKENSEKSSENHSAPASPMMGAITPRRQDRAVSPKGIVAPQPAQDQLRTPVNGSARPLLQVGASNILKMKPIRPYLRQTGVLDRLLDIVMSDGPENRMALICSACQTHNGMATAAEYPFISYRCFECNYANAAKKMINVKSNHGLNTSHSTAGSLHKIENDAVEKIEEKEGSPVGNVTTVENTSD